MTALLDPPPLKWNDLVPPGTPLPTPWSKEEYEASPTPGAAAQIRAETGGRDGGALPRADGAKRTLRRGEHAGKVGAFEGAKYEAHGYYPPELDCIMFTRTPAFCAVCRRAIDTVIRFAG